jgi:5'-3' exonuclease
LANPRDSGVPVMSQSFSSMTAKGDNTLVVDLLNLAFRWKHQGRSDFRYEIQKTIKSFATSYKCKNVIITTDFGSSTYRLGLDPLYKSGRKRDKAKQTAEEKVAFEEFLEEYIASQEVLAEDWPILRYQGVEADDIAAHLVANKTEYSLGDIWLISSDRDWDLLVQNNVSRFSYVTRKEITLDNWSDHYGVSQEQYVSYKCLVGDKGDDVPGVPQVGDKRAISLLQNYESAMDIYDAIPVPGTYQYIKNLNASGDRILKNYELMDLLTYCDDAIGPENIGDIKRILDEYRDNGSI